MWYKEDRHWKIKLGVYSLNTFLLNMKGRENYNFFCKSNAGLIWHDWFLSSIIFLISKKVLEFSTAHLNYICIHREEHVWWFSLIVSHFALYWKLIQLVKATFFVYIFFHHTALMMLTIWACQAFIRLFSVLTAFLFIWPPSFTKRDIMQMNFAICFKRTYWCCCRL